MRRPFVKVFGVLVYGAAYLCAAAFIGLSLEAVHGLVHSLGHSARPLSWIALAMDDWTPIPTGVPAALVAYAILHQLLRLREPPAKARRRNIAAMGVFLAGAVVVLATLGLLWAWEGRHLAGYHRPAIVDVFTRTSLVLGASLVLGIAAWAASLTTARFRRGLVLLPPASAVISLAILAAWTETILPEMTMLALWPGRAPIVAVIAFILGVGAVAALAERRLEGRWDRALGLVHAAVWMVAGFISAMLLNVASHMCTKMGPNAVQSAGGMILGAVFLAAAAVRLLVFFRRRRLARQRDDCL